jgi:hypothetical protein
LAVFFVSAVTAKRSAAPAGTTLAAARPNNIT